MSGLVGGLAWPAWPGQSPAGPKSDRTPNAAVIPTGDAGRTNPQPARREATARTPKRSLLCRRTGTRWPACRDGYPACGVTALHHKRTRSHGEQRGTTVNAARLHGVAIHSFAQVNARNNSPSTAGRTRSASANGRSRSGTSLSSQAAVRTTGSVSPRPRSSSRPANWSCRSASNRAIATAGRRNGPTPPRSRWRTRSVQSCGR